MFSWKVFRKKNLGPLQTHSNSYSTEGRGLVSDTPPLSPWWLQAPQALHKPRYSVLKDTSSFSDSLLPARANRQGSPQLQERDPNRRPTPKVTPPVGAHRQAACLPRPAHNRWAQHFCAAVTWPVTAPLPCGPRALDPGTQLEGTRSLGARLTGPLWPAQAPSPDPSSDPLFPAQALSSTPHLSPPSSPLPLPLSPHPKHPALSFVPLLSPLLPLLRSSRPRPLPGPGTSRPPASQPSPSSFLPLRLPRVPAALRTG
jgi:hypothetical protein